MSLPFQCHFSCGESGGCLCWWLMSCLTHRPHVSPINTLQQLPVLACFENLGATLLTHTCFYLTALEGLTLNSATTTMPMSPADPNWANHWHKTPVFSLFLNKAPETGCWVTRNTEPLFYPPLGLMPLLLFGSLKGRATLIGLRRLRCHNDWLLSFKIRMRNAEGWGCLLGGWVSTRKSSLEQESGLSGSVRWINRVPVWRRARISLVQINGS